MSESTLRRNKAFVLEAFETLFNKQRLRGSRALLVAELHPAQRTHSARSRRTVRPGPLVAGNLRYENQLIVAEGDMLMLHGRFSGLGLPANWIVVDIVRIENGLLAEHWDVIAGRGHPGKICSAAFLCLASASRPNDQADRISGLQPNGTAHD